LAEGEDGLGRGVHVHALRRLREVRDHPSPSTLNEHSVCRPVYCWRTSRSRFRRSAAMSQFETLLWDEPEPGIVLITLNRPPMNPVTIAMLDEIRAAMTEVAADPKIRAVIFTGTGDKAFSAGADMAQFEEEFAKAAEEAERYGMVWKVDDDDQLNPEAVALARKLSKKAPLALGMAKAVLRACVDTDMTSGHTLEMIAQNVLMDSKDHNEGVRAFLERRTPTFTGR